MLYVEYKWAKRPGRMGIFHKSKRVGVRSKFVRGSQPGLARWKIANLTDEYKPHEFFAILSFDNLSNWVENSPQCNPRLQAAYNKHRFIRGNIAHRYIRRLSGEE
jgi:hypothetical protein